MQGGCHGESLPLPHDGQIAEMPGNEVRGTREGAGRLALVPNGKWGSPLQGGNIQRNTDYVDQVRNKFDESSQRGA